MIINQTIYKSHLAHPCLGEDDNIFVILTKKKKKRMNPRQKDI